MIDVSGFDTDSVITCESINPDDSLAQTSEYHRIFKGVRLDLNSVDIGRIITITGMLHQYAPAEISSNKHIKSFVGICPILDFEYGDKNPFNNEDIHKM